MIMKERSVSGIVSYEYSMDAIWHGMRCGLEKACDLVRILCDFVVNSTYYEKVL